MVAHVTDGQFRCFGAHFRVEETGRKTCKGLGIVLGYRNQKIRTKISWQVGWACLSFYPCLFFLSYAFSFPVFSSSTFFLFVFFSIFLYSTPSLQFIMNLPLYCRLEVLSDFPESCADYQFCISSLASWHGTHITSSQSLPVVSISDPLSGKSMPILLEKTTFLWSPSISSFLRLHICAYMATKSTQFPRMQWLDHKWALWPTWSQWYQCQNFLHWVVMLVE